MRRFIKQALVVALIAGGAIALSGCYESTGSIVAASESIMPIKTGHYCEYDFANDQRQWSDTCNDAVITSPSANTYVIHNPDIDTTYTVHIDGKPLDSGDLEGNYITEACWDDPKDGKGCYVGTIHVIDNETFHWVYPACTSPDSGADPCKVGDETAARQAFASATTWGTDDLRKYVWKSN